MEAGSFKGGKDSRREVSAHGRRLARAVFPGDSCGYRSRNTLGRGFRIAMSSDGAVSDIGRVHKSGFRPAKPKRGLRRLRPATKPRSSCIRIRQSARTHFVLFAAAGEQSVARKMKKGEGGGNRRGKREEWSRGEKCAHYKKY